MKKHIFFILILLSFLSLPVMPARSEGEVTASSLKDLSATYFKDRKYDDFVVFLKSAIQKESSIEPAADYYIALARFTQLKFLEDSQGWDEYFSKGNSYREELEGAANKAALSLPQEDPLRLYARLLLWRYHNDQQDALRERSLADLTSGIAEFSKNAQAQGKDVLKEAADQLFSGGEKQAARQAYRKYVDILTSIETNDVNLKDAALKFYNDGNIAISEEIFNVYINRRLKSAAKEALVPELVDIAKLFCAGSTGQKDAAFAEEVFKKIEEAGGKDALNESLTYLRAYNLEKAKDFLKARDGYLDLLQRFPQTAHADEANFKIGIINTYVARDLSSGRSYFGKLLQKEDVSPQVISAIYQLGLLSQWENDLSKAKEYYAKVIERAKEDFGETVGLTKERMKEIEENKPIEYNLKTFLDVSLKKESANFDMRKLDLDSNPYRTKTINPVNIHSLDYPTDSGCMQPELQYLWSGHLGKDAHPQSVKSFDTSYNYKGTKEINLVVVSPQGTLDYSIDMVDID